ncbi:MAG: hypothetical protein GX298_11935 [Planctomycetes bacterium]|jgi:hypothetical protein|nr:hypothetical protein [Planctomycetota bacterium]
MSLIQPQDEPHKRTSMSLERPATGVLPPRFIASSNPYEVFYFFLTYNILRDISVNNGIRATITILISSVGFVKLQFFSKNFTLLHFWGYRKSPGKTAPFTLKNTESGGWGQGNAFISSWHIEID